MKPTISFDVGGVLDESADVFVPLLESAVEKGHRVIVVTAIGHGLPEKWGYTEEARYATSFSRLLGRGYIQGKHFHDLFVTPDPGGGGTTTGAYKNFVLLREKAAFHVDDNENVAKSIKCCPVVLYDTLMPTQEFLTVFWYRAQSEG